VVRALSLAADKWHKGLVRVLGDMSGWFTEPQRHILVW